MPQRPACNRPLYCLATPLKQPYWRVVLDRCGPSGTAATADGQENIVVTAAGVAARRRLSAHGQNPDSFRETLSRTARASRSQFVIEPLIEPMYRLTASLPSANVG